MSVVFVGTLEPTTLTNPDFPTDYFRVLENARVFGVPDDMTPICEDNGDFFCMDQTGVVRFWSHDGWSDESWPDLATWIREVWIGGN